MKLIYSNENSFLVNNMKNLVEAQRIEVFVKNEFAQGALGEISVFDAWPELWVVNDADFDRAMTIVDASQNQNHGSEWLCQGCFEKNDAAFEVCWQCQREKA
ncbi:DUF2007 domain-containing protein [Psychrobium sp. 1_MG-2023]|uniref:putative signal transducing protein n=1 Tax=Psychrobium sp. 1_MG-2023 TaxID=3062624 RepID=UPI000C34A015|nr:DUF2007 domain-containing protein [Psychrobium sp. 1_MG-2023]MDP2562841.1 DUF2007 domain-containing protein [Psychrobium sp. 1_MG-2023]PKF54280.1 hypothetical protein CW748_16250 [Alteromonadales bacterium alter-6D02]